MSVFVGKSLENKQKYKIQSIYIPKLYLQNFAVQNTTFDYALVKITPKLEFGNFIKLCGWDTSQPQSLHIIGYDEEKKDLLEFLKQSKLVKEQVKQCRYDTGEVIYTKNIQNKGGSPILSIKKDSISIVGVHKGAITTKLYKK